MLQFQLKTTVTFSHASLSGFDRKLSLSCSFLAKSAHKAWPSLWVRETRRCFCVERGDTLFVDVKLLHGNWKLINSLISAVWDSLSALLPRFFISSFTRFSLICVEFQISSFTCVDTQKDRQASSRDTLEANNITKYNIVFAPR